MKRRALLAGTAVLAAAPFAAARAADKTKIVGWHAMTAALGEQVQHMVDEFNKSQDAVEVQAVFKGGYADTSTDLEDHVVGALRAGDAIMIKGSLGSRMKRIVDALAKKFPERTPDETSA